MTQTTDTTTSARAAAVSEFPMLKPEEREALRRWLSGEQYACSTGIHEGFTGGYGEVNRLGYFEFPLPQKICDIWDRHFEEVAVERNRHQKQLQSLQAELAAANARIAMLEGKA